MNTTTRKDETRAGFERQGAGFESDTTNKAAHIMSVRHPRPGTKTFKALAALATAGDKGLTQSEFLGHTWRLAACIFELRSLYGCDISAMLVPAGAGRRVARYVLRGVRHESV